MTRAGRLLAGATALALVAGAVGCTRARRAPQPLPPVAASPTVTPLEPAPEQPPSTVTPPAPASPAPTPLPPPAPVERIEPSQLPKTYPRQVRIGLRSDLESVTLPCCDRGIVVEAGGQRFDADAPITVRPAAQPSSAPVWRLQVTAVRDQRPAADLARRLAAMTHESADDRFDAGSGLYRVRVGRWATRAEAEAAARRLKLLGLDAAWIVSEGGGVSRPALDVSQGIVTLRVDARVVSVRAPDGSGLRFDGKRYRGGLVVFLNDRGRLNLINELPVEQYLRGVVPSELGPAAHPSLDALEAQAVAARSYTLRNLRGFEDEGYDLCGTPQCQVYGGMDAEHPLSDRAVAETAGEVLLYDGEIAEALYSATCGGHTEDVETVFPLKRAPYLRGVPCIEAGSSRLDTGVPPRAWPGRLLEGFFPGEAPGVSAVALEGAIRRIVAAAGLAAPDDRLASLARGEVRRFLASMLDLRADARLFESPAELHALVVHPPADWSAQDRSFAAWLADGPLLSASNATEPLTASQARDLALHTALFLRAIEERPVAFSSLDGRTMVVSETGGERRYTLPDDLATWRIEGDEVRAGALQLDPGDPLSLFFDGGRLLGIAQRLAPGGATADPPRTSWTRFRTDAEVTAEVRTRFPGFELRDLQVISRGVSGRVGKLRLVGAEGRSVVVEGLAIRWTLDLPDTLFTARHLTPEHGRSGWLFTGSGHGHGVGMCQLGAYEMALRGLDYRAILHHYYTGVRIERIDYR